MKGIKQIYAQSWCLYLWIVAAGIALYFRTLFFELTYLDDNVWILDYHWYLKDFSNVLKIFLQPDLVTAIFYRPLIYLSFIIDAQWGGTAPFAYHFTNIIIHLVNVCLIFYLLQRLRHTKGLSFSFSVIFMVHPALTQAVAWIPGRTDSLLSVFVLSSFILFLNYREQRNAAGLGGHLFFLILALLTKETAVILPVLCLFYVLVMERRFDCDLLIFSWGGILAAWGIARKIILSDALQISPVIAGKSVISNSPAFLSYIGKVFFPVNLSVLPILEDTKLIYGIVAIVILAILLLMSRRKRVPYVVFGLCWFFLFLLPSLVISFLKHEYRLYIPMVGCLLLVMEIDFVKDIARRKNRGLAVSLIVISIFSWITWQYSSQYQDRFTFWNNAVRTSPHSPLAHRNLGAMYHLEGVLEKAEDEYKKALKLNPREKMVHNNLGLIYMNRNLFQKAEQEYNLEIMINPEYENVYNNFGILYYRQKRFKEAEAMWKKTLELNSRYIAAYKYLILYYYHQKDTRSAAYYVEQLKKKGIPVPKEYTQILNVN